MDINAVKIRRLGVPDTDLIRAFLNAAGNSLNTFRYFDKRSIDVIKNHLLTVGLFQNSELVGYGHLDKADDGVWLGIAVQEKAQGKGYGRRILEHLLEFARTNVKQTIRLSVDKDNTKAIDLYKKVGFHVIQSINDRSMVMELIQPSGKIFVSSLALMSRPVHEMIDIALQNEWPLEFSSGIPYFPGMEKVYLDASVTRMPHNYFPAPEVSFVLNLASSDPSIRLKSIEHCKKGLWLAKQSTSPFFAAHAGFCIDPDPNELGKKITIKSKLNKALNREIFLDSVREVLAYADELGIDFLVENNVIAAFNLTEEGENPLLCCDAADVQWLFKEINNTRLGLLLDTAHLKVTCQTLRLDIDQEVKAIEPFVRGVHHSDNDGVTDSNSPITETYWFNRYLENFRSSVHVLEVKNLTEESIQTQINLLANGSYSTNATRI